MSLSQSLQYIGSDPFKVLHAQKYTKGVDREELLSIIRNMDSDPFRVKMIDILCEKSKWSPNDSYSILNCFDSDPHKVGAMKIIISNRNFSENMLKMDAIYVLLKILEQMDSDPFRTEIVTMMCTKFKLCFTCKQVSDILEKMDSDPFRLKCFEIMKSSIIDSDANTILHTFDSDAFKGPIIDLFFGDSKGDSRVSKKKKSEDLNLFQSQDSAINFGNNTINIGGFSQILNGKNGGNYKFNVSGMYL